MKLTKFHLSLLLLSALACFSSANALADLADTIERIKPSIVVVGTYKKTNSPQFVLRGTGFVISNGNLVATNAHVVPEAGDPDAPVLVIQARNASGETQIRRAVLVNRDRNLSLIHISEPTRPY